MGEKYLIDMKNLKRDAMLFAIIALVFCLGRLSIYFIFSEFEESRITLAWIKRSLQFDFMSAAYFILPTAVITIAGMFSGREFLRLKKTYAVFAIMVAASLAVLNACYFFEYKSQFNFWIFGIFFDDAGAIFNTIKEQYPESLMILGFGAFFAALVFFVNAIFGKKSEKSERLPLKKSVLFCAAYAFLLFVLLRGVRISGRPLQVRDIAVTADEHMNNLIPTSAYCLKEEVFRFLTAKLSGGLKNFNAREKDLPHFLNSVFGGEFKTIDEPLKRVSKGALIERPSRIFVIICESHSAWPLIEDLPDYNIIPNTKKLLENSVFSRRSFPSGNGTMATVSSIISGIPYCGISVEGVLKKTDDFAFAKFMKRLGYSSTFYYGGQSTWLRLGEFASFMGFDRVVGGEKMGDVFGTVEWGVRDRDLFEFIEKSEIPENSFNMVLTVSNHQPYDVDLKAENCPAVLKSEDDNKIWHAWYTDKYLGIFIEKMLKKYPDSIFVITGDHPSRYKPEKIRKIDEFDHVVPIIFAGRGVQDIAFEKDFAKHLDIFPTLVEMIAPKGFEYKTWGESMFEKSRKVPPLYVKAIVSDGKIIGLSSSDCPEKMRELARKYHALAYYRSKNSKELPKEK